MRLAVNGTLLLVVLLLLTGCFPGRSLVVLLPDEEGNVGEIHVESGDRTVVIDEAYQSITTIAHFLKPAPPQAMARREVEDTFAASLAKEPQQRFRFEKQILYFLLNSIEMTPPSKAMLPKTVASLKSKPPSAIYVVGHTDRTGTEYYNLRISHLRASAVRQALIDGGIDGPIISISYFGETMPAVPTPDEVPEPKNRRAELVLQYQRSQ